MKLILMKEPFATIHYKYYNQNVWKRAIRNYNRFILSHCLSFLEVLIAWFCSNIHVISDRVIAFNSLAFALVSKIMTNNELFPCM